MSQREKPTNAVHVINNTVDNLQKIKARRNHEKEKEEKLWNRQHYIDAIETEYRRRTHEVLSNPDFIEARKEMDKHIPRIRDFALWKGWYEEIIEMKKIKDNNSLTSEQKKEKINEIKKWLSKSDINDIVKTFKKEKKNYFGASTDIAQDNEEIKNLHDKELVDYFINTYGHSENTFIKILNHSDKIEIRKILDILTEFNDELLSTECFEKLIWCIKLSDKYSLSSYDEANWNKLVQNLWKFKNYNEVVLLLVDKYKPTSYLRKLLYILDENESKIKKLSTEDIKNIVKKAEPNNVPNIVSKIEDSDEKFKLIKELIDASTYPHARCDFWGEKNIKDSILDITNFNLSKEQNLELLQLYIKNLSNKEGNFDHFIGETIESILMSKGLFTTIYEENALKNLLFPYFYKVWEKNNNSGMLFIQKFKDILNYEDWCNILNMNFRPINEFDNLLPENFSRSRYIKENLNWESIYYFLKTNNNKLDKTFIAECFKACILWDETLWFRDDAKKKVDLKYDSLYFDLKLSDLIDPNDYVRKIIEFQNIDLNWIERTLENFSQIWKKHILSKETKDIIIQKYGEKWKILVKKYNRVFPWWF